MECNIESRQTFTIAVDMAGLSTIEKALSFYSERAILPDGDPARDLSRQFTSMLLRMGRVKTESPSEPVNAPLLPPPSAEAPAVGEEAKVLVESEETPKETSVGANPLDVELESMMGDQPEGAS